MPARMLRPWTAVLLAGALACSGQENVPAPSAAPAGGQRVDAATAGSIAGRVRFDGDVPANPRVKVAADPMCARANAGGMSIEHYVVKDGGLDNVFVYVKDGLAKYQFDVPAAPVTLDQRGCRYVPRVVGARVGQPIQIGNSDETTHNVHSLPEVNREFNFAQYLKGQKNVQSFTAAEVMVPFKCDLHGWMAAYVGVVEHPFFAVTADGGRFELNGLPPGTYTVEAWHEKAGRQMQQVTVAAKEAKTVAFAFRAETVN